MKILFYVPGPVTSNNRVVRHVAIGKRVQVLKSEAARADHERIAAIARSAAAGVEGLPMLGMVSVDIVAYGTRADVDNVPKIILDAMAGSIYEDDRQVRHLSVTKEPKGPFVRYRVIVEEISPQNESQAA